MQGVRAPPRESHIGKEIGALRHKPLCQTRERKTKSLATKAETPTANPEVCTQALFDRSLCSEQNNIHLPICIRELYQWTGSVPLLHEKDGYQFVNQ